MTNKKKQNKKFYLSKYELTYLKDNRENLNIIKELDIRKFKETSWWLVITCGKKCNTEQFSIFQGPPVTNLVAAAQIEDKKSADEKPPTYPVTNYLCSQYCQNIIFSQTNNKDSKRLEELWIETKGNIDAIVMTLLDVPELISNVTQDKFTEMRQILRDKDVVFQEFLNRKKHMEQQQQQQTTEDTPQETPQETSQETPVKAPASV